MDIVNRITTDWPPWNVHVSDALPQSTGTQFRGCMPP